MNKNSVHSFFTTDFISPQHHSTILSLTMCLFLLSGDVSTPPTKFCRLHPSEPLKIFCFTCNQLTCRDCQLMSHMNHRCSDKVYISMLSILLHHLKTFHNKGTVNPLNNPLNISSLYILSLHNKSPPLLSEVYDQYTVIQVHTSKKPNIWNLTAASSVDVWTKQGVKTSPVLRLLLSGTSLLVKLWTS